MPTLTQTVSALRDQMREVEKAKQAAAQAEAALKEKALAQADAIHAAILQEGEMLRAEIKKRSAKLNDLGQQYAVAEKSRENMVEAFRELRRQAKDLGMSVPEINIRFDENGDPAALPKVGRPRKDAA